MRLSYYHYYLSFSRAELEQIPGDPDSVGLEIHLVKDGEHAGVYVCKSASSVWTWIQASTNTFRINNRLFCSLLAGFIKGHDIKILLGEETIEFKGREYRRLIKEEIQWKFPKSGSVK